MYGHPEEELKFKTGEMLAALHHDMHLPWLCGGDFNLLLTSEEKNRGKLSQAEIFREALVHVTLLI